MHVGESTEENQMFREGSGTMFDMLARVGRNMDDCTGQSPLANVQRAGLLGNGSFSKHRKTIWTNPIGS